jgi:membrane protein YqaA with SNARE-associated domain
VTQPLLTETQAYALLARNSFEAAIPFVPGNDYVFSLLLAFGYPPAVVVPLATICACFALMLMFGAGSIAARVLAPRLPAHAARNYHTVSLWAIRLAPLVLMLSGFGIFKLLPFVAGLFGVPTKRAMPFIVAGTALVHLLGWWVVAEG